MNTFKKQTQLNTYAALALIGSMAISTTSYAVEPSTDEQNDETTYWGIGIGSVLGGVIAGPPGIAIGATLGGALGWGQGEHESLKEAEAGLKAHLSLAESREATLKQQSKKLSQAEATIADLKQRYKLQEGMLEQRVKDAEINVEGVNSMTSSLVSALTQEIYFLKGESVLPPYAQQRLESLAELLGEKKDLSINLLGFADQTGPEEFNLKLSKARAQSVKNALVSYGVEPERLHVTAVGESEANIDLKDSANAVLDRRVSIALIVPDKSEQKDAQLDSIVSDSLDLALHTLNENNDELVLSAETMEAR